MNALGICLPGPRLLNLSKARNAPAQKSCLSCSPSSRSAPRSSQGTQQVSSNITDVQRGATETGSASSQVLSSAQMLSGDSNRLKVEVSKFLSSVRAA
jgi:methyl-accepting chemotaxis protein